MNLHLKKHDILKKTAQTGLMTLISRFLGIFREILLAQFFGVGAMSDAFYAAFKLPNYLRHIFAEGAMSAAFVPAFVKSLKEGDKKEASGLLTISFLFFESLTLLLSIVVFFKTEFIMRLLAPGFSQERLNFAIPFLRLLFPLLILVSSSTLFAGALNAVNCFAIPAFGVVLWNMCYVGGAIVALYFIQSPTVICVGILLGGFLWMCMNIALYLRHGFSIGHISSHSVKDFKQVLIKFLPCFFGVGIVETNLFISNILASYLSTGLPTLLYYGSRFMNIPLGVFAVAFSTVIFAHFSRVVLYAPKRLNFYILEVAKFVSWIIFPATLFLMFVSHHLFLNVMLAKTKDPVLAAQGAWILIIYLIGLVFFCLNKSLLSIFYAMKDTTSTTIALICSALTNLCGDMLGIYYFGAYGFAAASSASGIVVTLVCFYFLHKKHNFTFYAKNYFNFLCRYILQLLMVGAFFVFGYFAILAIVGQGAWFHFFNVGLGYWILVGILGAISMMLLFLSRKMFGIKLHFLDK